MNYFLKINKNILIYSLIIFLAIPIFGLNFFISFLGNILLLLFLIPILLLLLIIIGLNFYKSNLNQCNECGFIALGSNEKCMNCGADIKNINQRDVIENKPSESTIEVKAEEIR